MHSYHGRYHGSAMDALEIVCARTTDVVMVWPWMLWSDKAKALKFSIPTYIYIYICIQYIYIYICIYVSAGPQRKARALAHDAQGLGFRLFGHPSFEGR